MCDCVFLLLFSGNFKKPFVSLLGFYYTARLCVSALTHLVDGKADSGVSENKLGSIIRK